MGDTSLAGRSKAKEAAPRPAASYKEALAWLYGTQRLGIKLGLENIRRLLAELNIPQAGQRIIHVAGTNGKGSVCAMIDSICRAQGYHTGLFTSPHLVTFRERIRVNGEMISEEDVARSLTTIRELIADWDPHPTFFEITTALALKHFSDTKIHILILETGLGGRLDSTNAIQSNVAVITPIDLDHQKWLGQTIREIAKEKAGIIKPKIPAVSALQLMEAEQIIRERAVECEAPLKIVTECYEQSPVGLRGAHQKRNAAIALAAIRAARIEIDDSAAALGLASVEWPARFQFWDRRTVIDGAHNPAAARVLAHTWREAFADERATVILAILSDKDAPGICEVLTSISDYILLPKIRSERALPPNQLAQVLSNITPELQYSITPSFTEAFELARAKSAPILITGSLHFAGEALAYLQGNPAAYEECAQ